MENLDLDINNYTLKDLEKFFRIKPNSKYTAADIELKEYQIREQLLSSGHINRRFKRDLIEFLTLAKNWLIFVKCNKDIINKQPTTIPKNYKLDPYDTPVSKEPGSRAEDIITRKDTQYVYANTSEFFPGTLNPLNTRIITKCLNIDTRFRPDFYSTQSSDFIIQLPTKFSKVVSMQLASLELPVTFYGISTYFGNNYFYLSVNYTDFDVSGSIINSEQLFVVPDGNYNACDLIDVLNNLLCPTKPDGTILNPHIIFSYIQFSLSVTGTGSGTGLVIIQPNEVYPGTINQIVIDFSKNINGEIDNTDVFRKFGWNLGFVKNYYTGTPMITSDTVMEPAAIRYIYLAVDDFNNSSNNHFVSVFNKSIMQPNILARISIKGSFFSLIIENDYNIITEPRYYFGPVDIQKLRIRLYDEHGRVLHMNNSNFSFCLNLKMLYDL